MDENQDKEVNNKNEKPEEIKTENNEVIETKEENANQTNNEVVETKEENDDGQCWLYPE